MSTSTPELEPAVHEQLARELLDAERTSRPIAPLTARRPDLSIADAYAIQRAGRALRVADGRRLVGRKVGLTSAAMQEMLGVDQPDLGYLTQDMVHADGVRLSCGALLEPRVEAEIAFRLARPLRGTGVDRAEVLAATEAIAPAIEVIDSRIADWRITIADTIADNASSGCVVLGEFRPLGELDLAAIEMQMTVALPDGTAGERLEGRGDAVLGHPAEAVVWLVHALAEYGEGVEAGEVVLPGAMARAVPVPPGGGVEAVFAELGAVTMTIDEER